MNKGSYYVLYLSQHWQIYCFQEPVSPIGSINQLGKKLCRVKVGRGERKEQKSNFK